MRRLLVAAITLAASACGESQPKTAPPPAQVDVTTLAQGTVVDATEYLATLRSRTAATIQPQVDGAVTAILVQPGETVEANQPLVRIDPGRQPAAVAAAQATRAAQAAQLQLDEENLRRVQKLVADGALARQELDNATAAVTAARAQVAASGAQITSNQVQLRFYQVVAPARGTVGDIPVRVGDRVTPQTMLTTVTDNSVLEANVSVPVDRARDISQATTRIDLTDDAGHVIGRGTVKFVSAQVNPDTQSVLVKADIDNANDHLRADQVVRARVVWGEHPGLHVPALAVTRVGGQSFVYVDDHGVAKQRPVQLGDLVDNQYVVLGGVAAGDHVVTSNLQKLRDGAPIQAKQSGQAKQPKAG